MPLQVDIHAAYRGIVLCEFGF